MNKLNLSKVIVNPKKKENKHSTNTIKNHLSRIIALNTLS